MAWNNELNNAIEQIINERERALEIIGKEKIYQKIKGKVSDEQLNELIEQGFIRETLIGVFEVVN